MLLEGKNILVTGVLTPQSIAFLIAEVAQRQGANILLTGFGRGKSLTERSAKRLDPQPDVLELDVTNEAHYPALREEVGKRWDRLDGIVHAIGFAPEDALGGNFLKTPWESVQTAFQVSTFSLKELAATLAPLMPPGSGIVTLDFDNTTQAWPTYDWMGVCKAALTSTVRYLARDLGPKGIRVNSLAAGPLVTVAAKGIPGFKTLERRWTKQAPLGWDSRNRHPQVARAAVALLSDWFEATTGEIIHVDGGYHAIGAAPIDPDAPENGE